MAGFTYVKVHGVLFFEAINWTEQEMGRPLPLGLQDEVRSSFLPFAYCEFGD